MGNKSLYNTLLDLVKQIRTSINGKSAELSTVSVMKYVWTNICQYLFVMLPAFL